ncbi:MAG: extracellular solute-binding protein [Rhodoferax sp.]|nr:extracellular solute-binding protein [Rhodoferax sp.]MCF8208665.1 extracellular solute-binding protein [Rhodoferax sp.]
MIRRLTVLACLFGALWVSGCDRAPDKTAASAPRTAVTFLHYFSDSLSGGMGELARTFNQMNSPYELKSVSLDHEAFKTSVQATLKAGNPPDLYSSWAGARTAALVDDLEPIDDIWQSAQLDTRFAPALVRSASQYQGKKYLIPLTQHYVAFFYNKKIFQANGVEPPQTWSAFLEVCATLKKKGVVPIALGAKDKWPAQFWFDLLLLRSAPLEFREKLMAGDARYDDPRVKAVFAEWAGLLSKGYFNASPAPNDLAWDSGANEMVYQGTAAMTLMGSWNIGFFSNDAHRWVGGKDFDFFAFPTMDGGLPVVSLGPIDGVVLPKRAANPAGAKAVMAYLSDMEAQQAISRGSGALAPNLLVPVDFYSPIQQRVREAVSKSPYFAFNYDLSTPPAVAELGLNAFSEFLAFPSAYPQILAKLSADAAARFQAAKP